MKFDLLFLKNTTAGKIYGNENTVVNSVSIDSRKTKKGALFIALKGERLDGHDFLNEAMVLANAAMVSKNVQINKPYVLVNNTLKSFHILAKSIRNKINPFVISITGSVGKSSLKNLLYQALSEDLKNIEASEGNLNSITGLPLSICNASERCKYLLLEAGINKFGEMEVLSFISEPNIAIITGIRPVHTEFLLNLDEIAKEKSKILKHLKKGGAVIFPAKDKRISKAISGYKVKKIPYGKNTNVFGKILKDNGFFGAEIEIKAGNKTFLLKIPNGYLHLNTIEASFCFYNYLGIDFKNLINAIKNYKPLEGRLNLFKSKAGFYVVNDSYNASPYSLKNLLEKMKKTPTKGKKILIFGDMLELGKKANYYHKEAGKIASDVVDLIYCYGELSKTTAKEFEKNGKKAYIFEDFEKCGKELMKILKKDDWVLIKGSRGMKMERILNFLEVKNAL